MIGARAVPAFPGQALHFWGPRWGLRIGDWGLRGMLTDAQCRKAVPGDKPYKLADEKGLYLYVTPAGFKSWRLKFRFGQKEKKLILGPYPEISLAQARDKRDEARRLLREGIDPSVDRRQRAAQAQIASANTFEAIAAEWHRVKKPSWAPRYAQQIEERLKVHVYPALGKLPIGAITAALVLQTIRAIEARGTHEMAHLVRQYISAVFVYAIGAGIAQDDPAHAIRSALAPVQKGKRPALLKLEDARTVITSIDSRAGVSVTTKLASRLLALTAARPGVIPLAARSEFEGLDGPEPIWRIPAAKMKLSSERKRDVTWEFIIPLSTQAVETVQIALQLAGRRDYLFPSVRATAKPMTNNTLNVLYRRAGFEGRHVPHGWRASFSTILNEAASRAGNREDRAIIDLMLAHVPEGVEAAYNRAAYLPRRRELAQQWADMLMEGIDPPSALLRG